MRPTLTIPRSLLAVALLFIAIAPAWGEYHHIHLTANDPAEGAQWYAKHFEGVLPTGPRIDSVRFGKVSLLFFKRTKEFSGSVGSGVDHIGFSVTDIEPTMKALEDSGVKILSGVRDLRGFKIAFVEDPWGTKIEVVQDPDLLGLHHIHLHSADVDATQTWYQDVFGGESFDTYKGLPIKGVNYGSLLLMIAPDNKELASTKGRSIDHLGFSTPTIDADYEDLISRGITFGVKPFNMGVTRISFVNGPDGVNIEYLGPSSR